MENQVPEIEKSAFVIKENGIVGMTVNFAAQVIVETSHGKWEEARAFFFTFEVKVLTTITYPEPNKPQFSFQLKTLDFPMLKVFSGDGEEMFFEEMLLQSMLNVQTEMITQKFGKHSSPMKDIS